MSPDVAVASTVRWPVSAAAARRLARAVLAGEGARGGTLALAFVGPTRMRALNRAWFGKDRPTDVIAFSYGGRAGGRTAAPTPLGEVFICPAVAERNARQYGVPAREETLRLIVHGVLHVLGYDHPDGTARVMSPMWRRQERYLAGFQRCR